MPYGICFSLHLECYLWIWKRSRESTVSPKCGSPVYPLIPNHQPCFIMSSQCIDCVSSFHFIIAAIKTPWASSCVFPLNNGCLLLSTIMNIIICNQPLRASTVINQKELQHLLTIVEIIDSLLLFYSILFYSDYSILFYSPSSVSMPGL